MVAQLLRLRQPASHTARTSSHALPSLGWSGQPSLSDRLLGRHLLHLGFARLPALLQQHCFERRLRLLEPRPGRTYVCSQWRRARPRTLCPLDAARHLPARDAQSQHQERQHAEGTMATGSGISGSSYRCHPATLRTRSLSLHCRTPSLGDRCLYLPPTLLRLS